MNIVPKDFFIAFLSLIFMYFVFMLFVFEGVFDSGSFKRELDKPTKPSPLLTRINEPQIITLILTGDVMLGRTVMKKGMEVNDLRYPFRGVSEKLKAADIVFINLENPIIENCPYHDTGLKLCARPEMVEGLVFSGVDIVSLANNHSLDYGKQGLLETVNILDGEGILSAGLGEVVVIEKRGFKFGFLGFNFTVNEPTDFELELIEDAANRVDVLVVGVHWGEEYTNSPKDYQKRWAKDIVERGADVVVGHHPHWVQDVEYIDRSADGFGGTGKPVFYSLGNFVFDQMWSEETRRGMAVELTFKAGELISQSLYGTYMKNWAQPEFVD